jgi:TetR/AcrR family transcriptional repressor of nem operon
MARPTEFDRDEALAKAIEVFAEPRLRGFVDRRAAGADGHRPPEPVRRVRRQEAPLPAGAGTLQRLQPGPDGGRPEPSKGRRARIEAALLAFARNRRPRRKGCLGVGSIAEFGRADPEINAINDAAGRRFKAAFAARLAQGVAAGRSRPTSRSRPPRTFLLTVRAGLKIAARDGAGVERLQSTVRLAMRGLRSLALLFLCRALRGRLALGRPLALRGGGLALRALLALGGGRLALAGLLGGGRALGLGGLQGLAGLALGRAGRTLAGAWATTRGAAGRAAPQITGPRPVGT